MYCPHCKMELRKEETYTIDGETFCARCGAKVAEQVVQSSTPTPGSQQSGNPQPGNPWRGDQQPGNPWRGDQQPGNPQWASMPGMVQRPTHVQERTSPCFLVLGLVMLQLSLNGMMSYLLPVFEVPTWYGGTYSGFEMIDELKEMSGLALPDSGWFFALHCCILAGIFGILSIRKPGFARGTLAAAIAAIFLALACFAERIENVQFGFTAFILWMVAEIVVAGITLGQKERRG